MYSEPAPGSLKQDGAHQVTRYSTSTQQRTRLEELEHALSDRDRRYQRLEQAADTARAKTTTLAEELAKATSSLVEATVKTAELGQLVEELQDEKASRLGARLRRGFGAAPGSTGRDGGK